jgi:hypothetical protein
MLNTATASLPCTLQATILLILVRQKRKSADFDGVDRRISLSAASTLWQRLIDIG